MAGDNYCSTFTPIGLVVSRLRSRPFPEYQAEAESWTIA